MTRRRRGQAAGNGAAARYADAFLHAAVTLADWTVKVGNVRDMSAQQGREVVIVEAVRTPVGRGHLEKGYYKDVHPADLLGKTYTEVLDRAGVDPAEVEDVIAGCVQQFGEQGFNVARNAWLQEGLPIEAAATTIDRQCGSAQQAVNFGAALIAAGIHDVVIGSGVEHMGHLPFGAAMKTQQEYGAAFTAKLMEKHNIVGQGLGAEMIADQWEIPRSELDELALRSHQRAARATEEGKFEREMLPFKVNGDTYVADQGIRPDTSLEALAALKPVFREDGRITAGNSSQISDGAAAVLLMSREKADQLGVRPRARIVDQTTVGCDPVKMLEGPIPATAKILRRNEMSIGDIDFVEINEAFAPVVAAWAREHSPDMDRVNPRGGAMAIGHPLGSTGARLLTTLLHELEDEDKEIGLVTMCCGGGLGTATLIQRI
jgi:acetyl-CoA acyltransferase